VTPMEALHFGLNSPASVVITGIDSPAILDQAFQAVQSFGPMDSRQVAAILAKTKEAALTGKFELFKTSSHYDGTIKNPSWLGYTNGWEEPPQLHLRVFHRKLLSAGNAQMRLTWADVTPEVFRQIHNNGFGSTSDDNPLERDVTGGIDFLVRKPCRDIKEIPCLQRRIELTSLAPPNVRRSAEDIGDRVLFSMVMDCCTGSRLDKE
jgi:hypothetical protein